MSLQVRVGGQWVSQIAGWGELQYSTATDGGCKEASWRMDLPRTFSHPSLVRNKIVEIRDTGINVWKGFLTEPDVDDGWTFHALGLAEYARADFLALGATGKPTSNPDIAVDQAISRGLPWTRLASLSNTAFATNDETDSLNYVGDLLDAWANDNSKRWSVDADGVVSARVAPTVPTWHMAPGSGRFGLADDEYASDLYIRYAAATGGVAVVTVGDADARAKFGRREYAVDARARGRINITQATAIGNARLAKGNARQGYTNGVEVTKYQITTPGGTPAYLPFVKGGDLVRQHGVLNEQGQPLPYLEWEIGETNYQAGARTLTLTPVGLVARDMAKVLEVVALKKKKKAS